MNKTQIAKEILTTRGVNSCVYINELDGKQKPERRLWTELHIGLHDFDVVESKSALLNKIMDLEGIGILWESSNEDIRKYHYWNLTCKTPTEILIDGTLLGADCKHITHGFRRKKWVLRIAPKIKEGEIYKPAPKFLHTICNPSSRPQSKAHFRLFKALTGKTIFEQGDYVFIGRSVQTEAYMTITDKMKGVL